MGVFQQLGMYTRFAVGLRGYLKTPTDLEQCKETVKARLEHRGDNLLDMMRRCIFGCPDSPYGRLLAAAGCELGDVENLVGSEGVEGALQHLADQGVFVSIEEFKGKVEAVRGSRVFSFQESEFDNPMCPGHLAARTGATRSAGTRTVYDLDHMAEKWAVHQIIRLHAYGCESFPIGLWLPVMPGVGPLAVLAFAKAGIIPRRWFSPVDEKGFKPSLKNRAGTLFIVVAGRLCGAALPKPEHVGLRDALVIARWISEMIDRHGGCYVATYVSGAVRICEAAAGNGLDLTGAVFSVGSEPFSEAKRARIEAVGARAYPVYAFMEAGLVGLGCGRPAGGVDYHLMDDFLALIQRSREVAHGDEPVDAFLFTSLLASAPKILLNVETGDYGVVERRSCGCRLSSLGFDLHVRDIRSYEKLTGEGMTFSGTDLARFVEEVIPSKLGGGPHDFQIVEEEDEDGHTRMSVLVHPRLGEIDEQAVVDIVLEELSKGSDAQRMMVQVWRRAGTLRVRRAEPLLTERGKLFPVHIRRES